MTNASWLFHRLRSMSVPEVLWRLAQRRIEHAEKRRFEHDPVPVTAFVFNEALSGLEPDPARLHLNYENDVFSTDRTIRLLSGAEYEEYKTRWNAGFQTDNVWPDTFSYRLKYKQRGEIGDARTNWELNRHFQFALLAKNYAASGDRSFLDEFIHLFHDWNGKNAFLHGISWTSVMEAAIRCGNWCHAYAFLKHGGAPEALLEELRIGILNMTDYVAQHYSRFSSANNHLVVEAYAIGQSGILFGKRDWLDLAVHLLTEELPRQNWSDGVNREQSLHYQAFSMEALGLMTRLLEKNGMEVPPGWKPMLTKMSRFVADCMGEHGEIIAFGDDDEGKLLDLQGGELPYYHYVLSMMSLLLAERYGDPDAPPCETLRWLFDRNETDAVREKERYVSPQYRCYREGGYTILRSADRKVLIGIDHGALGFGTIAAHGHADALSIQVFREGAPVLPDPGTGLYHGDPSARGPFRATANHNTVCVGGRSQSVPLGPFLWGWKADAVLEEYREENGGVRLTASHNGYRPVIHRRTFAFDGDRTLTISDELSSEANGEAAFLFVPGEHPHQNGDQVTLGNAVLRFSVPADRIRPDRFVYSPAYGLTEQTTGVRVSFAGRLTTKIRFS
ncbi:MAG: alginate lyase family protein [Oscillospiraceae bacterium]|nr:alginate lyase family protein [Oscillospiraceae bacterium]